MKIEEITLTEEAQSKILGNSILIKIDGMEVFNVYDGEHEDNNLSRNFNDCLGIIGMMKKAFNAGKNGETFDIIYHEVDEIE